MASPDEVRIEVMNRIDTSALLGRSRRVLCLGAHCDDIEIGCGGTLLKLLRENKGVEVTWAIACSNARRAREAKRAAARFLKGARRSQVILGTFRDGFLPYLGPKVKDFFEKLKKRVSPDLILTPGRHDLHQDHRLVSELTWNTFRDHLVLEYEIPKYDGDLGVPNLYVHLDRKECREKIRLLRECYPSQTRKDWFTDDLFWALLRLRGMESRSPSRFAEGFTGRKLTF